MKKLLIVQIILLTSAFVTAYKGYSQPGTVKQVKLTDFFLQSSSLIGESGEKISAVQYKSNVY